MCLAAVLLAGLIASNALAAPAAAQQSAALPACPVSYDASGGGLLFGGVGSTCKGGCRPRNSEVSRTCGFQGPQDDVWGLCSPQQLQNNQRECVCVLCFLSFFVLGWSEVTLRLFTAVLTRLAGLIYRLCWCLPCHRATR